MAGYSQIPAVPQVSNPFRAWRWSDAFGTEAIPELPSGSPVAVTQGSAVNSSGDVVGTQSPLGNGQTAFFFSDATGLVDMSDPILPLFSQPQAINESGQVVGYYNTTGNSPARAYIWSLAGGMVDIGPGDPTDWSYTYDVNDLGHVVGAYYFSADQTTHPFFWNSSGATDITNAYGSAQAINESDQVVGSISFPPYDTSHAFMWSPSDGLTDIPELPGSAYASGQFINDSGQVAGTSYSASSDARAFLWSQADGLVDIGTLGGSNSYVYALSSSGDVYGESTTASGARHAFVWSDGDMVDLHQITYPISGMTVEQAYGALADGRIVVSLRTAGGSEVGLLNPAATPPPDTTAPTITLTTPPDGVQYTQGQVVTADYTCDDEPGGSGLASCSGTVGNGTAIDTSIIGINQSFVVNATDNATNSASVTHHYTVIPAPLAVTSLNPSSIARGAIKAVTINGSGFVSGATISIVAPAGGITITGTAFVNSTRLTATFSATASATIGTRTVRVTNPGGAFVNCSGCLTVNPKPTLTTVTPSAGPQGGTKNVTLAGTGFDPNAVVSFGAGITVNSVSGGGSSLTVNISIDLSAPTGSRVVTVTNPDGGLVTKTNGFTVNPPPGIASIAPTSRAQGVTSNIAINGAGFLGGANFLTSGGQISFGSGITVNSVARNSASRLTANISISPSAASGSRTVTVTNPDGGSATCPSCFAVSDAPTVSSVLPASGGAGATRTISITGTGFQPGAIVSLGGSGVTVSTTWNSSMSLTLDVSIGNGAAIGSRNLVVTNLDAGSTTCAGCFTVNPRPTITSPLSPNVMARGTSGATVTVNGTGFQPGATVTFSGTGVTAIVVSVGTGGTTITLSVSVASNAATTNRTVTVLNQDGGSRPLANAFKITT